VKVLIFLLMIICDSAIVFATENLNCNSNVKLFVFHETKGSMDAYKAGVKVREFMLTSFLSTGEYKIPSQVLKYDESGEVTKESRHGKNIYQLFFVHRDDPYFYLAFRDESHAKAREVLVAFLEESKKLKESTASYRAGLSTRDFMIASYDKKELVYSFPLMTEEPTKKAEKNVYRRHQAYRNEEDYLEAFKGKKYTDVLEAYHYLSNPVVAINWGYRYRQYMIAHFDKMNNQFIFPKRTSDPARKYEDVLAQMLGRHKKNPLFWEPFNSEKYQNELEALKRRAKLNNE
jgi:hypothetical protein